MGTGKTLTGNLGTAVLTCVLLIRLGYLTDLYHTTSLDFFFKDPQNENCFDDHCKLASHPVVEAL